jgi:GTP-binding protein
MSPIPERPLVAIVGRPNVGKSSLFNRMLGERRAIVEPSAGVTRDRLVLPCVIPDPERAIDLMDTGGIGIVDRDDLAASVEIQVQTALHAADLVLFIVDAREGRQHLDQEVARHLRAAGVRVIIVANKCESRESELNLPDFARLGFGEPIPVSAQEGRGLGDLYTAMAPFLPEDAPRPGEERLRIAVLGRRNVGKSSFVNALLREERVIVSPVPGTTRDAIDADLEWEGHAITLVDTAGLHRKDRVANAVEFYSLARTDEALSRADVALLFMDLTVEPARLDLALARTILDRYKPALVIGSKRDLVPDFTVSDFREQVAARVPHLRESPVALVSNLTGEGLERVMRQAVALGEEARTRVGTGALNRALEHVMTHLRFRGRSEKPRAFYATQVGTSPPTFLLFVNRKDLFEREALRAIARALGERLGLKQVPVRLVLREREREEWGSREGRG